MSDTVNPATGRKFHFYGRRVGRPLHGGRRSALESGLQQYEITDIENVAEGSVDPALFFGDDAAKYGDIWLEIGFGNGEHLIEQAKRHRDVGFIGCEPFVNGVSAMLLAAQKNNLSNIRVFPDDARVLMHALADASIGRCFILHSDPWPKSRHHRRRFIQHETVATLARLLKPGAELRVSSDDPGLAAWSLSKIHANRLLEWTARRAGDWRVRLNDWFETRYENKGLEAGRPPFYIRFVKKQGKT